MSLPTIDFSEGRFKTAREGAKWLVEKRGVATVPYITQVAQAASEVSALGLLRDTTNTLRSLAEETGLRRDYRVSASRKVAHLNYIARAVMENAVAELPAYEPGERSPKIRTLESDLDSATAELAEYRRKAEIAEATLTYALEHLGNMGRVAVAAYGRGYAEAVL